MEPPSSRTAPAQDTLYSSSACAVAAGVETDVVEELGMLMAADEAIEVAALDAIGVATIEDATAPEDCLEPAAP